MRVRRVLRRSWLPAVIASLLLGCFPSPFPSATPEPTEAVAEGCSAELPDALVDTDVGYHLCMPPTWRDLGVDDPGWAVAFPGQRPEMQIALRNGTIDHFAVPVDPAAGQVDEHLVIDSVALADSDTLEALRDSHVDGYLAFGARLLSSEVVDIGGTRAARIALDISAVPGETLPGRLILYLALTPSSALYIRFTSATSVADELEPIFDAMAHTFKLEPAT